MEKAENRSYVRKRPHREPGPRGAWLRTQWRRAIGPWHWARAQRLRYMARSSTEHAHSWGGRGFWGWVLVVLAWAGTLAFAFRVYIEFRPVSAGAFRLPPEDRSEYHSGYELATAIAAPFALAGITYVLFLLRQKLTFRNPYRKDAIRRPQDLVQTSGTIIGEIIGRDDLCISIMEDLRNSHTRRPHVIVGGIGVGKTAMLVRLTTLLAQKGAVPVPVRLRDCATDLDFRKAAYQRFCELAELYGLYRAKADRVWQQLCNDNKVVVLAGGLEEALQGLGQKDNERDNMIRAAIHRARVEKLPVIIASRPHTPLRGMEASMTDLEPLSERDALVYLHRGGHRDEDARLQWIVETAQISEAPLYLQITDELNVAELLHHIAPRQDRDRLDTRDVDRIGLRRRLIETWVKAVVDGYLHSEVLLDQKARQATVEQLSALACAGLMKDTMEVSFSDFESCADLGQPLQNVSRRLNTELKRLHVRLDFQLAAAYGQQLGFVEARGSGVRFQHSIMQAYLGSRYANAVLQDEACVRLALQKPGREFLMALVMYTRSGRDDFSGATPKDWAPRIVELLCEHARKRAVGDSRSIERVDAKVFDLYSSAVQIIPETNPDWFPRVVREVRNLVSAAQYHPEVVVDENRALVEARLSFVGRLGEAMRRVENKSLSMSEQLADKRQEALIATYRELFALGGCEPSYPVRLASTQEIGCGGDLAFRALQEELRPPAEQQALLRQPDLETTEQEEQDLRQQVMRAWLMPMLAGSVTHGENQRPASREPARLARFYLDGWIHHAVSPGADEAFPVGLRIALAQGFKYAANWRRLNPYSSVESREYLAERAKDMLHSVDFWYSRMALLHALTLWALPDGPDDPVGRRQRPRSPDVLVRHWMVMREDEAVRAAKDSWAEHPFVALAARLCVLALETGQPERFLWIDESGVLSKTGSGPRTAEVSVRRHLWIPPSAGWSALDPRAQQLVADVTIFLNLAEGDQGPKDRERRLAETARATLPSCLTRDRTPLDPVQTIGVARILQPGSRPGCASDCLFDLCPYPLKGGQLRAELSEAFCRRQRIILRAQGRVRSLRFRATAPWQGQTKNQLKRFWELMAVRARR